MTDVWILLALAMPALLARTPWFRSVAAAAAPTRDPQDKPSSPMPGTLEIALPLALTGVAVWISDLASSWLAARGVVVPSVLIVTTLALLIAQIPAVSRLRAAHAIGLWAVYLFLAVVGANADIAALQVAGALTPLLFAYVTVIFAVHAVFLIGGGALFKFEPVVLAVASAANIGGGTTAFVIAEAENREDLVLPAILVGSVGTALGTYAGFAVVAIFS